MSEKATWAYVVVQHGCQETPVFISNDEEAVKRWVGAATFKQYSQSGLKLKYTVHLVEEVRLK